MDFMFRYSYIECYLNTINFKLFSIASLPRGVYWDFVCEDFLSGGSCNEGHDQGGISFRGIFSLFSLGLLMRFPEICQRN